MKTETLKKIAATILCFALTVTLLSACAAKQSGESVTLSGKENVLELENNFSSQAANYLETICKINSKKELRTYIVNELMNAGYSQNQIEIQKIKALGLLTGYNIVLTVPGKSTERQIVVGGHYDGDGAGDNGSGTALLLAEAVGLSDAMPDCTVKYVFFDYEELGSFGSKGFVKNMSEDEIKSTLFMVNIDSVAFGDYVCVYGGKQENNIVTQTGAYELAMKCADSLGFNTYGTEYLDGYFAENSTGPKLDKKGVFTNPWTIENPAVKNMSAISPSTVPASDHVPFYNVDIPYIYFEATNWFAEGKGGRYAYTGYYETYDKTIGKDGMFMNTKHDTLENLEKYFPGRAMEHFNIYSPLLSKLILEPHSK